MENPYEGQYYQPYTPQPEPEVQDYQGNTGFASASLVMSILAIVFACCFPPAILAFAGLGILFSCLSKGRYARPGAAKAGMAISVSCLAIFWAFILILFTMLLTTDKGQSFMRDYYTLITSPEVSQEDLYDFMYKYIYGNDEYSYPSGSDGYNGYDSYDDYNNYDGYDSYDDYNGFDGYDNYDDYNGSDGYDSYDDYKDFFEQLPDSPQPRTAPGSGVI